MKRILPISTFAVYIAATDVTVNGVKQRVSAVTYDDLVTKAIIDEPYKFGGKELVTANGLNEYDFGARQYYPAVHCFTKPDQHCEKYCWLSPYLYCGNNPVNNTDPTGIDLLASSADDNGKLWQWEHDVSSMEESKKIRLHLFVNQG